MAVTLEQRSAGTEFYLRQAPAHRRLVDAKPAGCRKERPRPSNFKHNSKMVPSELRER
ncbi:hypothetical protein GCM10023067_55920 [Aminobacter aganoensis]